MPDLSTPSSGAAATQPTERSKPARRSKPAKPAAGKAAAKAAAPQAAQKAKQAAPSKTKSAQAAKAPKPKKPKLVRDSYTIPKDEYAVLAQLKERCKALERAVKKSELLRAGLRALAAMSDKALHAAVQAVPPLKTGRPSKR